ncbi:MAG TPA: nucleotidyltransferase [Phycisphaerae bacterium]|nr:nucleotidyltransferase [Phycisphaerae bacterium]
MIPHLHQDFKEFIELLNARGVKYLLVGGYAVAFHGVPRYTGDIDFVVEPSPENSIKLIEVLRDFGFDSLRLNPSDFQREDQVLQLGVEPVRIDVLTSIAGVKFDEAYREREEAEIRGLRVQIIGREHLLRNKRAAARPQDLADCAKIEKS